MNSVSQILREDCTHAPTGVVDNRALQTDQSSLGCVTFHDNLSWFLHNNNNNNNNNNNFISPNGW